MPFMPSIRDLSKLLWLAVLVLPARAQQPSAAEHAALLKANLAASQMVLRQYEWVETTVVSVKGEQKSRKQQKCYYGADGQLQKIDLSETPEPEKRRGLRGRIAERKKEELTDTMKQALALVKTYVPPDPTRIQAAKDSGKMSVDVVEPGKRVRLVFRDYEKPGDSLSIEVDLTNNKPLALAVATYLEKPADKVSLAVKMGQLLDGTTFPSTINLQVPGDHLAVDITNSGYRRVSL
jgi:hypothetical protein